MQLQCFDCKKMKDELLFIKDKYATRGYKSYCKECQSIKVIRRKISKLTTAQERTDYLIWLIINNRTVKQCVTYFQLSQNEITECLKLWGWISETESKWCPQCKRFKHICNFINDKSNKRFGKMCWCVSCWFNYKTQQYVIDRNKKRFQEIYSTSEGKKQKLQESKEYYYRNQENRLSYMRKYYNDHSAEQNARVRFRKLKQKKATPLWADFEIIKLFYKESKRLTEETGVLFEVDHIIPLQSNLVCGLHVHNNLQIISKR